MVGQLVVEEHIQRIFAQRVVVERTQRAQLGKLGEQQSQQFGICRTERHPIRG
jgi:hypothetical protein